MPLFAWFLKTNRSDNVIDWQKTLFETSYENSKWGKQSGASRYKQDRNLTAIPGNESCYETNGSMDFHPAFYHRYSLGRHFQRLLQRGYSALPAETIRQVHPIFQSRDTVESTKLESLSGDGPGLLSTGRQNRRGSNDGFKSTEQSQQSTFTLISK